MGPTKLNLWCLTYPPPTTSKTWPVYRVSVIPLTDNVTLSLPKISITVFPCISYTRLNIRCHIDTNSFEIFTLSTTEVLCFFRIFNRPNTVLCRNCTSHNSYKELSQSLPLRELIGLLKVFKLVPPSRNMMYTQLPGGEKIFRGDTQKYMGLTHLVDLE